MPIPLIPVVIDEATKADAGNWRAALPYVRFPVSEYRADARCSREGVCPSPSALPADLTPSEIVEGGEDIEAAYEAFSVLKWRLDSARARRAS